jgi:hypothetical protein
MNRFNHGIHCTDFSFDSFSFTRTIIPTFSPIAVLNSELAKIACVRDRIRA